MTTCLQIFVRFHKFQNIYLQIYLCFKSCILVSDDGPYGPKHVEFTDDIIKSLLCMMVTYIPTPVCHSITGWISLQTPN